MLIITICALRLCGFDLASEGAEVPSKRERAAWWADAECCLMFRSKIAALCGQALVSHWLSCPVTHADVFNPWTALPESIRYCLDCIRPQANDNQMSQKEVYEFNVPTFGKGVVFDVDNATRAEQA